jgi:hypothetical protein
VSDQAYRDFYRYLYDHEPPAVLSRDDIWRLENNLKRRPLEEELSLRERFALPQLPREEMLRERERAEHLRRLTKEKLEQWRKRRKQ